MDPNVQSCRILRDTIDYDNIRVHNFDLRQTDWGGETNKLCEYIYDTWTTYGFNNETELLIDLIMCYIADIPYTLNESVTVQDIIDELAEADLDNVDKDKLNAGFVINLEKVKTKIDKETNKFNENGILSDTVNLKQEIYEQLLESGHEAGDPENFKIGLLITDIYLLLRLLKRFESKDRGPRRCRNATAQNQNRIIIYAGDR
jgi:hypothetical protein